MIASTHFERVKSRNNQTNAAGQPAKRVGTQHYKAATIVEFPPVGKPSYIVVVDGFFDIMTAFPTVAFAGLSMLSLLYWTLVIVGAADLDALDGLAGKSEGLLEGAVDAVTGAAKGGTSMLGEALAALGFTKVPLTVSISLFSFIGFFLSVSTRHLLDPVLPGVLSALAATVVGVVGAAASTSLITRPLRGMFVEGAQQRQGGKDLLGRTCTITIDVDSRGGQARIDNEIIVRVRAVGQQLARGTEVVIMDRDDDGVFIVEPLAAVMPTTNDAFARLQQDADDAVDVAAASASISTPHKS